MNVCMSVLVCTHFLLSEIETCEKNFTKFLIKPTKNKRKKKNNSL
jgi:hypothetical protein